MADRYAELRNNPNVQEFFNLISKSEGTIRNGQRGYNILFGGDTFDSYGAHPQVYRNFTQTDGRQNRSSAAGAYQITNTTYQDVAPKLGITGFTPEDQDRIALALIDRRGALDDVLNGNYASAINKLGNEWASFPSSPYPQRTNSMESILGTAGQQAAQVVDTPQGPQVAVPTTPYEISTLEMLGDRGHDTGTMGQLARAVALISQARDSVLNSGRLLGEVLPSDLDDDLLDLIERA